MAFQGKAIGAQGIFTRMDSSIGQEFAKTLAAYEAANILATIKQPQEL